MLVAFCGQISIHFYMPLTFIYHLAVDGLCSVVDRMSDYRSRGCDLEFQFGYITYMVIDQEIFLVILSFSLIQEGCLSVTGISMCTSTG